jgi:Domain of unknown function (DUF4375)
MSRREIVSWFDKHWLNTFTRGWQHGFDSLSHKDRVLALVGAVFDHLIGAGVRVLYEGPAGAHSREMAESFAAIGAKRVADLLRQFDRAFPGGRPAPDDDERERQVAELPKEAFDSWSEISDLFDEVVPGGERVLLTQLYDWYHAQDDRQPRS